MAQNRKNASAPGPAQFQWQPHVLQELQALEKISPSSGFALQITDYDGQDHRFANRKMPVGPSETDPFAGAIQVVSLDYGDYYKSLRIYVSDGDAQMPAATRHAVVLKALEITGFLGRRAESNRAA